MPLNGKDTSGGLILVDSALCRDEGGQRRDGAIGAGELINMYGYNIH